MKKRRIDKIKLLCQKYIFGILLGTLISGMIGVYAVITFPSNDVSYDNSSSGLKSNNVQGAIDELYKDSNYQQNNIKTNNNSTTTYELNAENLSYDNSKTGLDCKNVQCVIDEITKKLNK